MSDAPMPTRTLPDPWTIEAHDVVSALMSDRILGLAPDEAHARLALVLGASTLAFIAVEIEKWVGRRRTGGGGLTAPLAGAGVRR